jgi:hypothetical protein
VLFSLGNLAAGLAAPKPATAAPASEGSGLIDIRAMRAMLDDESSAGAARAPRQGPAELLPSFAGGGFDALSADPLPSVAPHLAPNPAVRPAVKPAARGPNTVLVVIAGLLGLGLLGLGAMVVLDEPREVVATPELIAVPGPVEEAKGEQPAPEPEPEPEQVEPEVEPEAPVAAPPTRTPAKRNRTTSKTTPTTSNTTTPPKTTTPAPASKDEIDVDCLIDKTLPKCNKGASKPGKASPSTSTPKPTADLPAKLDQSQILAGINPVKTAAKSCGSGTTVAIKFSVKGSTGAVISAQPLGEHASSSVGKCVASSANKASFAKFGAEQQGFTFKFRL